MIIQSIIERKLGTNTKVGDTTYHFNATEKEPRHLCEVTNPEHIERLLSIKEGYREAEGKAKEPKKQEPAPAKEVKTEQTETTPAPAEPTAPVQADEKPVEPAAPVVPEQLAASVAEIDRDALLVEAKALKIKSAHLFGNAKLAEAVAAAKANV